MRNKGPFGPFGGQLGNMDKDISAPVATDPSKNDEAAVWAAKWNIVCGLLRAEIGKAAYQSWLKPITVREMLDGVVRISVPTRFMRDWVVAHYAERLKDNGQPPSLS